MRKDNRHYYRGWNSALDTLRGQVCEIPEHIPLIPGHEAVLDVVRFLIDELHQHEDRLKTKTNAELAERYGMSRRCVQVWRRQGCDFSNRRSVMRFARTRRTLPPGFKAQYGHLIAKGTGQSGLRNEVRMLRGLMTAGVQSRVA